jgi:hormone-sensitive lipase
VPIFSIDYRKSPEHLYPCALDDVWQAYNWILQRVHLFFNIKPRRIVLVGDSAGGNLTIGLALRYIKLGVRVPDGILSIYPGNQFYLIINYKNIALNLSANKYTPSLLHSLDDTILSHKVLKVC